MFNHCRSILSFIVCFCILSNVHAQEIGSVKVNLHLRHATLHDVIKAIQAQCSLSFLAKAEDVEAVKGIDIDAKDEPLDKVLTRIFRGRNIQFRQAGNQILLRAVEAPQPPKTQVVAAAYHTVANISISGHVKSKRTGETVIGATVKATGSNGRVGATASNEYGFYSLTLPAGYYRLEITAVGMELQSMQINADSNVVWDVAMNEASKDLQEVTVRASTGGRSLRNPQMGVEKLSMSEVKSIPVIFGEKDILKTIQLLPGIKSAGDGNSGFYVRGGAADQNLILLDEAPVYNPSHLLGFFSTFNSDAIKNITVYKAGMPAQYGGRLSSVLDVKMNDGNNQNLGVSGGIGLIASRINIEGPIEKDKASFLISGRRTYADAFLKLSTDTSVRKAQLYFYDLNGKVNWKLGEKDKLYLSGYFGRDKLGQADIAGIDWGNTTATLRWNHIFNSRLFSNTSLIYSNYDFTITNKQAGNEFHILSQIRDWNLKEELQWYANGKNTINVGFNSIHHTMRPGDITAGAESSLNSMEFQRRYSLENAAYVTNTWKATDKLSLTYGLRFGAFSILDTVDRWKIQKTYYNLEPRVAMGYQLNGSTAIKASYVRNTQNLHLISNSVASSPTDRWVASTNIIKPEISDQVALGLYKDLADGKYEFTSETYYKSMQHQIDYKDGADVYTNQPIETQLLYGKGRAYGIELLIKKKTGRLNGWVGYTLSKTERRIDGINDNKWYNARQDRTHDISVVGIYQLNKKWTLSADWVYYTGDAVTFPSGKYKVDGDVYFLYTKRNGYRMPNYHRLDFGATCQLKKTKKFSSELVLSLYNVYGRQNAYQITFREGKDDPTKTEAVQTALFRWIPSISYNFKF